MHNATSHLNEPGVEIYYWLSVEDDLSFSTCRKSNNSMNTNNPSMK